jgi:hypothetical protein
MKTSMAKHMGSIRDLQALSWLSGPRTDVPAEPPSHGPFYLSLRIYPVFFYPIPNKFEETVMVVVVWQLDLQLSIQSVPITTNVASSNPVHGKVYLIQHYMIKLVSDLRQVGCFLRVHRFPPSIKNTATI